MTQYDLDAIGQQRQEAAPSFHIFSPETAQIFTMMGKTKLAEFCIIVHEGVSVLTSNKWEPEENKLHCPFGMFLENQLMALNRFKMCLEQLQFKLKPKEGRKRKTSEAWKMVPFQKGLTITISATIMLQRDLQMCNNVPYVLTEWLTQVKFHPFHILSINWP